MTGISDVFILLLVLRTEDELLILSLWGRRVLQKADWQLSSCQLGAALGMCKEISRSKTGQTPVSAFPGEAVQAVEPLTLRQCLAPALDSGSCSMHPAALGQQGEEKGRTSGSAEQGVSGRGCPAWLAMDSGAFCRNCLQGQV